jgi:hypothetical protein
MEVLVRLGRLRQQARRQPVAALRLLDHPSEQRVNFAVTKPRKRARQVPGQ